MQHIFINPSREQWPGILQRPVFDSKPLEVTVSAILEDIRTGGDAAVKKYSLQFDKVQPGELKVSAAEIAAAAQLVSDALKQAIDMAISNITAFHESQRETVKVIHSQEGLSCWRKSVAIQKVGLYIPGGTAPLFSTLLMLGIPARLAGCTDIVVCTPCDTAGNINPVILYTAGKLGLQQIYKVGGVQAIGAMAYGTASIPQVYKIFGPGNQYVTCAKQLVNKQGVAIDMPAGPSEVAVYADASCNPAFVAADLLSQAEHGVDSQVLLVATGKTEVEKVMNEINKQLPSLSRKRIAETAIQHSRFVVMSDIAAAFDMLNAYAPEHLILASADADKLAERVVNAGSVFIGHYSPESVGDYASGTNHTLPTNGHAKAYSGVSLDSFVKKISFQQLSATGLKNIGSTVEQMALAEGLDAHANAVTIRLKEINNNEGI